jgi:hypothetical protein
MPIRKAKGTKRLRYESKAYRAYRDAAGFHALNKGFMEFMIESISRISLTRRIMGFVEVEPPPKPQPKFELELVKYDRRKRVYPIPSDWVFKPVQFSVPEYVIPINTLFRLETA